MWHFRNDERSFAADRFRPKSSFNPRNKESSQRHVLAACKKDYQTLRFLLKDLTILQKEEREALYSLKDDPSIIIKGADKGSVVVVWDKEDYLKVAIQTAS